MIPLLVVLSDNLDLNITDEELNIGYAGSSL